MAKYLDPKADLTFKRVFGEHPNLVASLLNSLLPLPGGEEIADIEYMSPERVPRTSIGKNSIVDRKSTRLNSSHPTTSRMPSSA